MLESKLNHGAIEAFAELFSKKVCDAYFEDTDAISGREIVEVSPVKQVNYFVLKILFRKWQKETLRLQSPYFNYRSEDVRKALLSFMNVLSQQIKVNRENFEPLLRQATKETVLIVVSPFDFFKEELTGHESGKLNDKYLKNSSKYIKINKHIFDVYSESFEEKSEGELSHADAIALLSNVFSKSDMAAEEVEEYEKQFNELMEIDFSTFVEAVVSADADADQDDEEVEEDDDVDEQEDPDDIDDDQEDDEDDEDSLTVEDSEETSIVAEAEDQDEIVRFVDEEEGSKPEYDTLEEIEEDEKPTNSPFEFSDKEESEEEDDELSPLNKQFSSEKTPLHEQLKSEQRPSLAEVHQSQKIESITGTITVNQRYMFVNELFSNDNSLFVEAMSKVEGCDSFDEAVELLIQTYSKKLEWDMNAPEVKELLKIVFKKFR